MGSTKIKQINPDALEGVRRFFPDSVFREKDPVDERLLAVREFCLTLREWRIEDYTELRALRKRVEILEGELEELKEQKNAPPDAAEGAEMAFAGLSRA